MWIRLAAAGGSFVPVPEAVAIYRTYPASRSHCFDGTWETGQALLRKSRAYHGPACALCRRALARGRQGLRRFCIDPLIHDLYVSKARGGIPALLARVAREMRATTAPLRRNRESRTRTGKTSSYSGERSSGRRVFRK